MIFRNWFGRSLDDARFFWRPRRLWCKRRERGSFQSRRRGQGIQMLSIVDLFKGRHFDREIIILCVRWYLRFKLSFRILWR